MIGPPVRRIVAVTGGLLAGHLVLAGIYWAFLQLPESNVAMLAASALLVVLLFAGMTGIQGQALLQFATDLPWRQRASQALKDPRPFMAAVLVWLVVSWLCGWVERRHEAHRGEIDAWLIAHADWTNTSWMHRTFEWILHGVRYVAGTSLAVGVLAAGVLGGLADVARLHWIRRALGVRRLAAVGLVVAALIWLPWRAMWWRPAFLPPGVIEPIAAALKLAVLAIVIHAGWTLILWLAARDAQTHKGL